MLVLQAVVKPDCVQVPPAWCKFSCYCMYSRSLSLQLLCLVECMCNEGSGWTGEDRLELLKGLSQVVLGIGGDSTAASVGVGVCVGRDCVGVSLDCDVCACMCLLLNQQYLVFVQIVAGYLPPSKYQCLCVSCQASGPLLSPVAASWSVWRGSACSSSHTLHCLALDSTSCFIWEITAQLSPLVFNFLSALTDQEESVCFGVFFQSKQGCNYQRVKRCGKVIPHRM